MFLAFILFWLVVGWALCDGDLYWRESAIFAMIWIALLAGFLFLPAYMIWFIVGIVLIDVILLMQVFGQDIVIR